MQNLKKSNSTSRPYNVTVDQLNCQLLVILADHGCLLEHILIILNMKHKANINPIGLSKGRALTLNIAITKHCHIFWHYFGRDKVIALIP